MIIAHKSMKLLVILCMVVLQFCLTVIIITERLLRAPIRAGIVDNIAKKEAILNLRQPL